MSTVATFYASAGAGIIGAVLTWIFLPDTTGLDLSEIDRMHRYMLAGQLEHYHGDAVKPRHLSLWERWKGYGARASGAAAGCLTVALSWHASGQQLESSRHGVRTPPSTVTLLAPPWANPTGKHYDPEADAQQKMLQDHVCKAIEEEVEGASPTTAASGAGSAQE